MLIRDITSVEGVRDNMLVGYGLVVGLRGRATAADHIHRADPGQRHAEDGGPDLLQLVVVKNVAAVFIILSLPAFARPVLKLDVTVSSIGDAKSLEGGVLLMSALLRAGRADLCRGARAAGDGRNTPVRHKRQGSECSQRRYDSTGSPVERDTSVDLSGFKRYRCFCTIPISVQRLNRQCCEQGVQQTGRQCYSQQPRRYQCR